MENTKFTPAPWNYIKTGISPCLRNIHHTVKDSINCNFDLEIAMVASKIRRGESDANAKLIAQSPNLLTDLNDAVSLLMKLDAVIPSELQETYGNLLINASVTIQKTTE